jgi:hypothetical protein
MLLTGCSEQNTSSPATSHVTTSPTTPTPGDVPTTDDLSTVIPPDPPTETPTPSRDRVLGTGDMTCDEEVCEKTVSVGGTIGPLGAAKERFTVSRIKKSTVTFSIDYRNGKRATLDLAPGEYAPFGDYEISVDTVTSRTAVVTVEPPTN